MNVNELTTSLYGHRINANSFNTNAGKITSKESSETKTKSFESILTDVALNNDKDITDDINVDELTKDFLNEFDNNDKKDSSELMNILTDAELAKEYLSSKSGRTLISTMAENSIASIISETEN